MSSFYDDTLLTWVQGLLGLDKVRVEAAASNVAAWNIAHLNHEFFSRPDIDNAVAVTQLCDAVLLLERAGIPKTKLIAKLRRDKDVWPTWAELRAAALLLRVTNGQLQLEVNRQLGKHADFLLSLENGAPISIEFKAIGLSDEEAEFCTRVAPVLDEVLPPEGLVTFHAALDVKPIHIKPAQLAEIHASAAAAAKNVANYPKGLSGVTVVGHGGEANYTRRMRLRLLNEIAKQIPPRDEGWAAFYWTNGAPSGSLLRTIQPGDLPPGLAGIILLGDAVAFPCPSMHSFVFISPAGAESTILRSGVDDKFAGRVLQRFEASSGVRADLLSTTDGQIRRNLIRRDGSRRILPFNLLMDSDPVDSKIEGVGPDWNPDRVLASRHVQ